MLRALAVACLAVTACGAPAADIKTAQAPSWPARPDLASVIETVMKESYPIDHRDDHEVVSQWVTFDDRGPVVMSDHDAGDTPRPKFSLAFIAEIVPAADGRVRVIVRARYSDVRDPDHNPYPYKHVVDVRGTEDNAPDEIALHILSLQRAIDARLDHRVPDRGPIPEVLLQ